MLGHPTNALERHFVVEMKENHPRQSAGQSCYRVPKRSHGYETFLATRARSHRLAASFAIYGVVSRSYLTAYVPGRASQLDYANNGGRTQPPSGLHNLIPKSDISSERAYVHTLRT